MQSSWNLFKQFDVNEDGEPEMIANLDVSGLHGGGKMTIRANSFVSEKGWVFANILGNKGNENEGEITFQVRDMVGIVKFL
jgi:hypothetical protein